MNADQHKTQFRDSECRSLKAIWEKDYFYPDYLKFSNLRISDWQNVQLSILNSLFSDPQLQISAREQLLFFDTETTGLAGGTGTIPFMFGFGFFSAGGFQVKVFALLDLSAEEQFLERIESFLQGFSFKALVTYNGNAFDLPLVRTRAILNRRPCFLNQYQSLDFLYAARRLWKRSFESCRLGYLGERMLGLSRDDDLQGDLIPVYYNQFLQTEQIEFIERIADHNALDLLGLAMLLLQGMFQLQNYQSVADQAILLSVGYLFLKNQEYEKAEKAFQLAAGQGSDLRLAHQAQKELALLFKRAKLISEALQLWENLAATMDHQVMHQLCIHYEHRERNFEKALQYTETVLQSEFLSLSQRLKWEKRLQRLREKLQQNQLKLAENDPIFSGQPADENGNY